MFNKEEILISDSNEDKYYTAEEVRNLVEGIDSATLTKLYKIAENLKIIYRYDAESLVHDAIVKLLEPEKGRRWRRNCSIFTVFKNICWSILDHHADRYKVEYSLNEPNQEGKEPIVDIQGKNPNPEQLLIAKDIREKIHLLFKGDSLATDLIDGRIENWKKCDLLEILNISDKEYETTWRRIRRRMKNSIKGGCYE